jgi:hypothetical protein
MNEGTKRVRLCLRGKQYNDDMHKVNLVLDVPADASEKEMTRLAEDVLPQYEWLDTHLLESLEQMEVANVRVEWAPDAKPSALVERDDDDGALDVVAEYGVDEEDLDAPITTGGELAEAVLAGRAAAVERLLRARQPGLLDWRFERYGQGGSRLTVVGPDPAMVFALYLLVAGESLSEPEIRAAQWDYLEPAGPAPGPQHRRRLDEQEREGLLLRLVAQERERLGQGPDADEQLPNYLLELAGMSDAVLLAHAEQRGKERLAEEARRELEREDEQL